MKKSVFSFIVLFFFILVESALADYFQPAPKMTEPPYHELSVGDIINIRQGTSLEVELPNESESDILQEIEKNMKGTIIRFHQLGGGNGCITDKEYAEVIILDPPLKGRIRFYLIATDLGIGCDPD